MKPLQLTQGEATAIFRALSSDLGQKALLDFDALAPGNLLAEALLGERTIEVVKDKEP